MSTSLAVSLPSAVASELNMQVSFSSLLKIPASDIGNCPEKPYIDTSISAPPPANPFPKDSWSLIHQLLCPPACLRRQLRPWCLPTPSPTSPPWKITRASPFQTESKNSWIPSQGALDSRGGRKDHHISPGDFPGGGGFQHRSITKWLSWHSPLCPLFSLLLQWRVFFPSRMKRNQVGFLLIFLTWNNNTYFLTWNSGNDNDVVVIIECKYNYG